MTSLVEIEDVAFDGLLRSFRRHLVASDKSPKTVRGYVTTAAKFAELCNRREFPDDVRLVERKHVEEYMIEVLATTTDTTAATYFAHLQQFFRYLVEVEEEIPSSPMAGMKRPRIAETPPDVFTRDELKAIIGACAGRTFNDRRDRAVVRLFADSGVRVEEMAGMTVDALDLSRGRVLVHGKGNKSRWVAYGNTTALDLERYLRERKRHPRADLPDLWLGAKGPLTDSGLYQLLERRGRAAGVDNVHPHRFRHTWSHEFRLAGGNDSDLQQLGGWSTPTMLRRYGQSAAQERAIEAAHRLSLGDEL